MCLYYNKHMNINASANRLGFTVFELLLVITVIGILMTLILPLPGVCRE